MKFLISTALLLCSGSLMANEVSLRTGYMSIFKGGEKGTVSNPLLAASYKADLGAMAVVIEGGATIGNDPDVNLSASASPAELADYVDDDKNFIYINAVIPFTTKLQNKELTFSAGPSIVTYNSTSYTVNSAQTGYTPETTRAFRIGLTTEVALNLFETDAFGADFYSTLPVNFHSDFGTGFSFGLKLDMGL
ncbi:hypothetical protein [Marinicellulosiphila megalodicopiae]|uniref:hypothetical protein n=1 Tax=Marinicellulosiphila megalodicopiae TaxID=2724896 RepID=UPI003BB0F9B2